jgi:hypothetical protein
VSAFNVVTLEAACPFCGHQQSWRLQFKYGHCWQFEYSVADEIRWGGNDYGRNVGGHVRLPAVAEAQCSTCGRDDVEAAVHLRDNRIESVEMLRQPLMLDGYFEVLP